MGRELTAEEARRLLVLARMKFAAAQRRVDEAWREYHRANRREAYRRENLPLEGWENEGGACYTERNQSKEGK